MGQYRYREGAGVEGGGASRLGWPHLGLAAVALIQIAGIVSTVGYYRRPNPGIQLRFFGEGALTVWPATREAAALMRDLPRPLELLAVNEHAVAKLPNLAELWRLVGEGSSARNRFIVQDSSGRRHVLVLSGAPVDMQVILRWSFVDLVFWLVGLLYLALGGFVWHRRPNDRTARALLALTLVAGFTSAISEDGTRIGLLSMFLRIGAFPLWGPAALWFGLVFTRSDRTPWGLWMARGALGLALGLGALRLVALGLRFGSAAPGARLFQASLTGTSVMLVVSVACFVWVVARAARPPHPPGVRRRARVLAWSAALGFLLPSVFPLIWPQTQPFELQLAMALVQMVCLASFPLNMAYAILRLQMFELRVVVRQGLVYATLSVLVTLGYLVLVLFTFGVIGRHARLSMVPAGLLVVALVLLFSVLKVRVQNAVDRLVFRSRYVYAEAISRASSRLSRVHTLEAVIATLRDALVQSMRLSRVFLALPCRGEPGSFDLHAIAAERPPNAPREPIVPPARLQSEAYAPIARVLATRDPASVYDAQAIEAAAQTSSAEDFGRSEATFWAMFGVDLVVPLLVGDDEVEWMGLLLVGPKLNGRSVNASDRQLLATLANQIAMALESARAFEEIHALKEGLEQQVRERTSELSEALRALQETQSQLIETQTLSTLARVVAGVVHELNSPLGGMRSASDSLRRLIERGRESAVASPGSPIADDRAISRLFKVGGGLLDLIDDGAKRIGQVATSLAQFVSLDEAPEQPIDLRHGLEGALELLKPQLESRVEVTRRYAVREARVQGNPARLNQVLFNLLENALKAIDGQGHIEVSVDVREGWAYVVIRDDGRGIPAEQLPELFEFGFGRKASGRVGLRTGLVHGKRVVEQLGGRLDIDSTPGRGTAVTVALPAV